MSIRRPAAATILLLAAALAGAKDTWTVPFPLIVRKTSRRGEAAALAGLAAAGFVLWRRRRPG